MAVDVEAQEDVRRARWAERAPSGGWRTIAAKELGDHVSSVRFIVLLLMVGLAAAVPLYFAADAIRDAASRVSGAPALFLALFTISVQDVGFVRTDALVAILAPLLGIAFGFDAVNVERAQGTLPRLLSQPIHRDDVINGKFAAGLAVIALMLASLVLIIGGFGMLRLGIVPALSEVARIAAWLLVTVLYVSFWLAFATLLSVVIRRSASAALVGFGVWLGLVVFGALVLGILANALFPIGPNVTFEEGLQTQGLRDLFLRLSPHTLYQDAVSVILNPGITSTVRPTTIGQLFAAQEQLPTLLSLEQSLLLVWPQVVILVALTVAMFALAYVLFLRQEVRA